MEQVKLKSDTFFKEQETEWEPIDQGISRQFVGYNTQIMMVKIRFEKGAVGYLHEHFHSQATYVAAGKFKVSIDGEEKVLEQGDGFLAHPNLQHGVECLENGLLIDVFSPVREDFLPSQR